MSNNMVKLGDIATFKTGPFGTQLSAKEYTSFGTPVINVKNIGYGSVVVEGIEYIGEETKNRLSEHLLKKGDIVFGRKGSVDRHAYIDDSCVGWMQGSDCIRVRCNKGINSRYISHYLKLDFVRKQITNAAVGSTMASLNVDILKEINISLPPVEIQDRIERFFTALEDKIVNNNLISETLLERVKTVYDYWFVQFEFPNEDGKPYKSSGGEMVWCEELNREIPKGWTYCKLNDCIQSINTGLNPRQNFVLGNGDVRYITVKNLTTDGTLDFDKCDTIDAAAKSIIHNRSDVSVGDILFASIAPLGRCYLVQEEPKTWEINESVFSIRGKAGVVTPEFLYLHFMSETFIKGATSSSTGSIFKGIRINTLLDLPIVLPPYELLCQFTEKVEQGLKLKYTMAEQTEQLKELRDWLLPLLMNGQATIE